MLDVKQAAALCNIGVSTLWKLVKEGGFPEPIRFGERCTRWRKQDVAAWACSLEPGTVIDIKNSNETSNESSCAN